MNDRYEVIVVGAGHAGCEAALSCAGTGLSTCLFTMNMDTIAQLSCNPAIGGMAKGHIVREIDALGGWMARVADISGIQFRVLNRSKGPAVWSLRAQMDRNGYRSNMQRRLSVTPNLDIKQASIEEIIVDRELTRVEAVKDALGVVYFAKAVIITTGTFLNGLIHIGTENFTAGRSGEFASIGLSRSLASLGFSMGRLKTGTPPRIDARSIDFDETEPQYGDAVPTPFSFSTDGISIEQMPCYITYTNAAAHEAIRSGLDKSPLYSGRIKGIGPRYCPSIEDKVVRFPERTRHQIFLEPEGAESREYYANGISTSLAYDTQLKMVRSIDGLHRAEIVRPGYAIEYDFVYPVQLCHTLETKLYKGLYLAGQINGTSGYEEAAAQGLMAGINASLAIRGEPPIVLKRSEAYIGVLIDDLVTRNTVEPYRMFTSRAEYRLLLRNDNADVRLTEKGYNAGLVSGQDYRRFREKVRAMDEEIVRLRSVKADPSELDDLLSGHGMTPLTEKTTLERILKRPSIGYEDIARLFPPAKRLSMDMAMYVESSIKYEGYIRQQMLEAERLTRVEARKIPEGFDYTIVKGLSSEILSKLNGVRPRTIGQAARIPGVTPAAISLLAIMVEKSRRAEG